MERKFKREEFKGNHIYTDGENKIRYWIFRNQNKNTKLNWYTVEVEFGYGNTNFSKTIKIRGIKDLEKAMEIAEGIENDTSEIRVKPNNLLNSNEMRW